MTQKVTLILIGLIAALLLGGYVFCEARTTVETFLPQWRIAEGRITQQAVRSKRSTSSLGGRTSKSTYVPEITYHYTVDGIGPRTRPPLLLLVPMFTTALMTTTLCAVRSKPILIRSGREAVDDILKDVPHIWRQ